MTGLPACLARLSSLPGKAKRACEKAALEAAKAAEAEARSLAPVRTGALRASIRASAAPSGAVVSASAPHAAPVEQGSGNRPAHPYLLPAVQKSDYAARAARALGEELR